MTEKQPQHRNLAEKADEEIKIVEENIAR